MNSIAIVKQAVTGLPKVVFEKNWNNTRIAGRGVFRPAYVLLHHTAGTDSLGWIRKGADHPPVPAANFLIARDGTVHVISAFITYHAGKGRLTGSCVPQDCMNQHSFGIEIESLGVKQDLTPEQIDSAVRLTRNLLHEMGDQPVQHALNHKTWSRTGKVDTLYSDAWWRAKIIGSKIGVDTTALTSKEAPVVQILSHTGKADDDWLSAKETVGREVRSNTDIYIDVNGVSRFRPEEDGRGGFAVYANFKLPPAMSAARAALERGKVRTWYEQLDGKIIDETGLNDARRIGLYGNRRLCIAHSWPHTKSKDEPVRFGVFVEAWNADGTKADVPLLLSTREGKIVGEDD